MRLFLAIAPPEAPRLGIHALCTPLRLAHPELRWVAPENFHFTVRFLGETEADALPALETALAAPLASRSSFALRLGALLSLPAGPRARVLALDLAEGVAELTELSAVVEGALRAAGFPAEPRPFRAHLTLARARRGDTLPAGLGADPARVPPQPVWRAGALYLYESLLRPRGPEYRVLSEYPLAT